MKTWLISISVAAILISGAIQATNSAVVNETKAVGETAVDRAKATGKAVMDETKAVGEAAVDKAKATGKAVMDETKAVGEAAVDKAKATGKAAMDETKAVGEAAVDKAKATGKAVMDETKAAGEAAVDKAKATGKAVMDEVKAASSEAKTVANEAEAADETTVDKAKAVGKATASEAEPVGEAESTDKTADKTKTVDKATAVEAKVRVCSACHGPNGNAVVPTWPKLAGQHAQYIYKQLMDFKNDVRKNSQMSPQVLSLDEQDFRDIAAYFSSRKQTPGAAADAASAELGERIYRGGNPTTGVVACTGCHGQRGAGLGAAKFPRVAGQHAQYLESTLKSFRAGDRANDPNGMMRDIVGRMSDKEITAVSRYMQGLTTSD